MVVFRNIYNVIIPWLFPIQKIVIDIDSIFIQYKVEFKGKFEMSYLNANQIVFSALEISFFVNNGHSYQNNIFIKDLFLPFTDWNHYFLEHILGIYYSVHSRKQTDFQHLKCFFIIYT